MLTTLESEALAWIAGGGTERVIAEAEGCSVMAVRQRLRHAKARLGAETLPNAVLLAYRAGLFEVESLPRVELTWRQVEFLALTGRGYRSTDVGEIYAMPDSSVRNVLRIVRARLGAHTTAHAVALAYMMGILK